MESISASVARQTLPAQLDRVEAGEEIRITRHGRVVAVLVNPAALAAVRAVDALRVADDIGTRLAAARGEPLPASSLPEGRADALADAVREQRRGV